MEELSISLKIPKTSKDPSAVEVGCLGHAAACFHGNRSSSNRHSSSRHPGCPPTPDRLPAELRLPGILAIL